jgi:hypothetical protein
MNRGLQEYAIRKLIRDKGIADDLIDVHALIDSTLSLPENFKLITEYINENQLPKYNKEEAVALTQKSNEQAFEEQVKYKISLSELFKKHNVIGLVGNRSTGKTMLALTELINLKAEHPKTNVYVFGIDENLKPYLKTKGIRWLYSKHDVLDMKIKNSVIFIDEAGQFFSTATRDKETDKMKRFISRINHLNNYVILSTAEVSWFNKLACSLINAFLVKRVEFNNLVNGTWLKDRVEGLETTSDYRLDIEANEYFILSEALTEKKTFEYDVNLDSKKSLVNPFKRVVK